VIAFSKLRGIISSKPHFCQRFNLGMIELAWLGAEFMKADLGSGLQPLLIMTAIASVWAFI